LNSAAKPTSTRPGICYLKEVAVRLLTASLAVGSLMLFGAMQIAVAQRAAPGTKIQLAAETASSGERHTYAHAMQEDMQQWQQRVHDFDEGVRAKGRQADIAMAETLNAAWDRTQVEARKVSAATAEGWAGAKASYENASHALASAWDKAQH
jgi:hypothetical protein